MADFGISHLFISAGHNYFGRHEKPPGEHPITEVERIQCVTAKGIAGDRFFGFKKQYKGQITFFEEEVYQDLCLRFGIRDRSPEAFRRNVITRGVRLNELIGKEFELQGIRFFGNEECRPCYWMDLAFAPGAEGALKGRGGLRAEILSDGFLTRTERDGNLALTQNPKLKTQDSKLADPDFQPSCSIISGAKQDSDAHD